MSEAVMTVVPTETSITEDVRSLADDLRAFTNRNSETIFMVGVIGVALLINRAIMRKELRNLNFSVDIYPPDEGIAYPTSFDD